MKAVIDRDLCIGCRLCEDTCPEVFRVGDDGIAYVIDPAPAPELYDDIQESVELCPVEAISVEA